MTKKIIGKVTHYYGEAGVAAVKLSGGLKIGDTIEIRGGEDQKVLKVKNHVVKSMQINKKNVKSAGKGDEIGIKIDKKVSPNNVVYKIT